MKLENVCVGTARIYGLKSQPFYSSEKEYYEWNITLSESTIPKFCDLTHIYLDKESIITAAQKLEKIKYNFNSIGIKEKDKVAVIFSEEDNKVIAIGCLGSDFWIDVNDAFSIKTFSMLNVVVTGLKVF